MIVIGNNDGYLQRFPVCWLDRGIGVELCPLRAIAGFNPTEVQPQQASLEHALKALAPGYPDDPVRQNFRRVPRVCM